MQDLAGGARRITSLQLTLHYEFREHRERLNSPAGSLRYERFVRSSVDSRRGGLRRGGKISRGLAGLADSRAESATETFDSCRSGDKHGKRGMSAKRVPRIIIRRAVAAEPLVPRTRTLSGHDRPEILSRCVGPLADRKHAVSGRAKPGKRLTRHEFLQHARTPPLDPHSGTLSLI